MQVKFASLSVVLSALFVSQVVGAVPSKVNCSVVRCAIVQWSVPDIGFQRVMLTRFPFLTVPSARWQKLRLGLAARPAPPALYCSVRQQFG